MATVRSRKRKDGTTAHQVIYYLRGVQCYQTHDTITSAQKAAQLMDQIGVEAALEVIVARTENHTTPSLREWCHEHIDTLTRASDGTKARYRRMVELDLGPLGPLPIDAITESAVARWVNAMKATGASAKTIQNKQGFVSAALRRAHKRGMIPANVAEGVRVPDDVVEERVFLTPDELAILVGFIRPSERDLVITLAGTGMRWGEATALKVKDWHHDHSTVSIVRAWKEGPTGVVLGAPKSRKARRTIDVSERVAEILDRHTIDKAPEDFIFTTPTGVPWKGSGHFHEFVWQPAIAAANGEVHMSARIKSRSKGFDPIKGKPWLEPAPKGKRLGKRPHVHSLRHTAAAWMIMDGVALPVVQDHLGHESIKTTVGTYGHLTPTARAGAAIALGRGLGAALPQIEG